VLTDPRHSCKLLSVTTKTALTVRVRSFIVFALSTFIRIQIFLYTDKHLLFLQSHYSQDGDTQGHAVCLSANGCDGNNLALCSQTQESDAASSSGEGWVLVVDSPAVHQRPDTRPQHLPAQLHRGGEYGDLYTAARCFPFAFT
jgi:hypothetical protein